MAYIGSQDEVDLLEISQTSKGDIAEFIYHGVTYKARRVKNTDALEGCLEAAFMAAIAGMMMASATLLGMWYQRERDVKDALMQGCNLSEIPTPHIAYTPNEYTVSLPEVEPHN